MKFVAAFLVAVGLTFSLAGCTKDVSPTTYDESSIGASARVEPGVIVSMRKIKIDQNTGVGGLGGAAAGGIAGSAIGGSGRANALGAIGGAVIGGLAANAIEKKINTKEGVEVIVKLNAGSIVSIAQQSDLELSVGQRVLVIYGRTVRVVPDNSQPETFSQTPTTSTSAPINSTETTSTTTTTTTIIKQAEDPNVTVNPKR